MSSMNFGSILIFASCVVGTCNLYANGRDGEYRETACLLSNTVHSFTPETQVKRRAKEGGEVQATLRDMWAGK